MKRTLIFISVLVFIGNLCNAQTETKPSSDTLSCAMLYIYRPADEVPYHYTFDIALTNSLLKDVDIGRLKNKTKFETMLYQEGKTEIYVKPKSEKIVIINVKFGERYYVKCGTISTFWGPEVNIELIEPKRGEPEYKNLGRKK